MKAEEFLANLHRGISTPAMFTCHIALPPEIGFAASLGLKLMPIQGQSRFASAIRLRFAYATSDPVQLRAFAAECQSSTCNWAMSAEGVAVLEYSPALGHHSLCELCDGDEAGWSDTLQFRSGVGRNATRFLLFRLHQVQKLRILGSRCVGVRLHSGTGNFVPVPPSRFLAGPQLIWENPSAAIEEVPWFLLDREGSADGRPPAAPAFPPVWNREYERRYVYDADSL
jgi:hypothetical protein